MFIKSFKIIVLLIWISCFLPVTYCKAVVYQVDFLPWSGYWWSYNQCGLANGTGYFDHPSPLEKYELYSLGVYPAELSNWYRENYCSESNPYWYGHCGHWALASAYENYEILPSSVNNILFRVGDKKALLTMMHTNDDVIRGDGTQPEVFHQWLLKYIKDEKKSFIADMSPDEEIWNYPIYKYEIVNYQAFPTKESIRVKVYCADDNVHPDYIGTLYRIYYFTYDLFLNSQGDITGGQWTGNSIDYHPEKMFFPLAAGTIAPLLDYDVVKNIAQSKDDEFENGQETPVLISPGTYNLILLDQDIYKISAKPGEKVSLTVELQSGGGNGFNMVITDKDSLVVAELTVDRLNSNISIMANAVNPPYYLRFFQSSYSTPGIYSLQFDRFRQHSTTIPFVPKDNTQSQFMITNYQNVNIQNIELSAYDTAGEPIQTLLGPLDMEPGEKKLFYFSDLPFNDHELPNMDSLRAASDSSFGFFNLVNYSQKRSGSVVQGRYIGTHLVFPYTASMFSSKTMYAKIINESDIAASVQLDLYNTDGNLQKSAIVDLSPRESFMLRQNYSPFFSMPESGWIEVYAMNGTNNISGFEHVQSSTSIENYFAFPVTEQVEQMILPLVVLEGWEANLTIINTTNAAANYALHPVKSGYNANSDYNFVLGSKGKKEININPYFGMNSSNRYVQSIISVNSDQAGAGYYTIKSSGYDDSVTLPLLGQEDFGSSLLLPHSFSLVDTGWWTGYAIINPSAVTVCQVTINPYDENGHLITEYVRNITLNPGAYYALSASNLNSGISYITFNTNNQNMQIGGFYIYANNQQGLSGANMKKID